MHSSYLEGGEGEDMGNKEEEKEMIAKEMQGKEEAGEDEEEIQRSEHEREYSTQQCVIPLADGLMLRSIARSQCDSGSHIASAQPSSPFAYGYSFVAISRTHMPNA